MKQSVFCDISFIKNINQKYQFSKMQLRVLIFVAIVSVAAAKSLQNTKPGDAVILRYENENIGVDGYNFAYETSDGSSRQEQAELKNAGSEDEAISVQGVYTYVGNDGVEYTVQYIADENGFQPQGDHIPSTGARK